VLIHLRRARGFLGGSRRELLGERRRLMQEKKIIKKGKRRSYYALQETKGGLKFEGGQNWKLCTQGLDSLKESSRLSHCREGKR